jgi:ornithine cyclodeaminase/alanine dehydrogenase-like protein (mu-crystallin family)
MPISVSPLVLYEADLTGVVSMSDAIAAVRAAHLEWGEHPPLNAICNRLHTSGSVRFCSHQGAVPGLRAGGVYIHCERLEETADRQTYAEQAPPVSVVFDATTGRLRGIVVGEPTCAELPHVRSVAGLRTAATSALGTLALARTDATTLGMIGSGKQAALHLIALHGQRPLTSVRVYSRNPRRRAAFAQRMSRILEVPVTAVDSPAEAVSGTGIVLTATNAMHPVLEGAWLAPGQHVTSIVGGVQGPGRPETRRGELDAEADERATVIGMASVVQARAGFSPLARLLTDSGSGDGDSATEAYPHWDKCVERADLMAGRHPGRCDGDAITIFKNNAGQGVADMAIAGLILDRATSGQDRAIGVG